MDDTTVSSCNNEEISSGNVNVMNDIEDILNNNITIMVPNDNKTHFDISNTDTIGLRPQQYILTIRFSGLLLSKLEGMEIDLFYLLKTSNAPLFLFDRIIDWVRRHESTLNQNDSNSLTKRKMLLQNLNQKLYHNEILMKPRVNHIRLSSGCITNILAFLVK